MNLDNHIGVRNIQGGAQDAEGGVMDCKSCQSWSQEKDDYTDHQAVQAGFGRCVKAPMLESVIDFNFETERYELMPESRDVRMCVMDGSSYRAELYTMPDFHCSEYRKKEEKDQS